MNYFRHCSIKNNFMVSIIKQVDNFKKHTNLYMLNNYIFKNKMFIILSYKMYILMYTLFRKYLTNFSFKFKLQIQIASIFLQQLQLVCIKISN
jgi:hypothetical protein